MGEAGRAAAVVDVVRVRDLVDGSADTGDAAVVLVDRLWPRGVRKEALPHDEWAKNAAPSTELRKAFHGGDVDFDAFAARYRAELSDDPASTAVEHLADLARDRGVALAYAAKDTENNHARVLAEEIRSRL